MNIESNWNQYSINEPFNRLIFKINIKKQLLKSFKDNYYYWVAHKGFKSIHYDNWYSLPLIDHFNAFMEK
jgi:hypothetical protein